MSHYSQSLLTLLPQASSSLASLPTDAPVNVRGLALDSRKVVPGDLFFARNGGRMRGADFVVDAQNRGAIAILVPAGELTSLERSRVQVPLIEVADLDRCIGEVASRFYGNPSRRCKVIGITGTNGKTSCASFLVQALERLGCSAAMIGTLGNGFWGQLSASDHTTPDPVSLQQLLARLQAQGAEYVVMEVSSHALDQQRVSGVHFAAAAFTNLTRDHLDYHGDMASYGDAKARLFVDYGPPVQLLNFDDVFGRALWQQLQPVTAQVRSFALSAPGADFGLDELSFLPDGIRFRFLGLTGEAIIKAPVMGGFNASNLLLAAGLLEALGFAVESVARALSSLDAVPGRMQMLPKVKGKPTVVVDFAHTPDALAQALQALRLHSGNVGRLVCVFGCGGDRDRGKRAEMGKVAVRLADRVLVTSDNPRSEHPDDIMRDILIGIPDQSRVQVNADRAAAIRQAIDTAAEQDLILLAGKGHEQWQETAGVRHPFSDFEHARHVLDEGAGV